MAPSINNMSGEPNNMKRLAFLMLGMAAIALGACNKGNEDAVQNAEMNQPEAEQLNELANQAAMDAANAQAAAQANIENATAQENATVDNTVNPQEADEQNVSGM
jgi:polyhydroxyalkanoate synthesis regulator phasin